MMDLDSVALLAQKCVESTPIVFVLGSGASISHGLPSMEQLAEYIAENMPPHLGADERSAWQDLVVHLATHKDLERALTEITIPQSLIRKIERLTWLRISDDDRRVYESIRSGARLPLANLFAHFCTIAAPKLDVVTTNYDRLAEYSAELAGQQAWTGFSRGYLQKWEGCHLAKKNGCAITVLKVHGSLDWFRNESTGEVFGVPLASEIPYGAIPQVVTPGLSKYQITHLDPFRTILSRADDILDKAGCFICIGYGFNDEHVHLKLLSRLRQQNANVILLTKKMTSAAQHCILKKAEPKRFLCLEESGTGTRVYYSESKAGDVLAHANLWTIDGLLSLLTGKY